MRKLDIFTHIWPKPFHEALLKTTGQMKDMHRRSEAVPMMTNLDRRFAGDGHVRRVPADAFARVAPAGRRGHARSLARAFAHRQRRHGRALPEISRPLSELHRVGGHARSGRRRRRGAPRGEGTRRVRHSDLYQRERQAARRARISSGIQGNGKPRQADLDSSRAHREISRTIRPSRNRSTRSGGRSAGPTNRARHRRASSSRKCWTRCRI